MNKMKKLSLLLLGLVLTFSLIACSPNNDDEEIEGQDLDQEEDVDQDEEEEKIVEDEEEVDEEEEQDLTEDDEEITPGDPIDVMIDESDYIAKIKLITKGKDNTEVKVLDSIKGNISSSDLPAMNNLEDNRAYVVFLKDEDGKVVLTDEEEGIVMLEGDNHKLFEKINKKVHNN